MCRRGPQSAGGFARQPRHHPQSTAGTGRRCAVVVVAECGTTPASVVPRTIDLLRANTRRNHGYRTPRSMVSKPGQGLAPGTLGRPSSDGHAPAARRLAGPRSLVALATELGAGGCPGARDRPATEQTRHPMARGTVASPGTMNTTRVLR